MRWLWIFGVGGAQNKLSGRSRPRKPWLKTFPEMSKEVGSIKIENNFEKFIVEWDAGLWKELKFLVKGELVQSPSFTFKGKQWRLELYPNGLNFSGGEENPLQVRTIIPQIFPTLAPSLSSFLSSVSTRELYLYLTLKLCIAKLYLLADFSNIQTLAKFRVEHLNVIARTHSAINFLLCLRGRPLHLPLAKSIIDFFRRNRKNIVKAADKFDTLFDDDLDLELLKEMSR